MHQAEPESNGEDIVATLAAVNEGDRSAAERLFALLYPQLRALAARYLRRERTGHSLQTTGLCHEAYLRLLKQRKIDWRNRAHFLAIAGQAIRRVLVDHARRRQMAKRGRRWQRVTLHDAVAAFAANEVDFAALNRALEKLATLHERQAEVVQLRFFGGLNLDEVVHVLGISRRTVERDWTMAKAWLRLELSKEDEGGA